MEIKINLDSLFGTTASSQAPPESPAYSSKSPSAPSSVKSHPRTLEFSHSMFGDGEVREAEGGDGRECRERPKRESQQGPISTTKNPPSAKVPGQRLYYESQNNVAKKMIERERIKCEQEEEKIREATFKPKLNKNSEKIVSQKGKQNILGKKKATNPVPSHILKEEKELLLCTHRPELKANASSHFQSKDRDRDKDRFEELYNDYKLKEVRMKIKTDERLPPKTDKKLSKQDFDNFLNRSNEFVTKVQKKNELILATSTKYDLQTGHKMFSPKTNNFKPHKNYFSSRAEEREGGSIPVHSINTKPLFAKNYDIYEEPQPFHFTGLPDAPPFQQIQEETEMDEAGEEGAGTGRSLHSDEDAANFGQIGFKMDMQQVHQPNNEASPREKQGQFYSQHNSVSNKSRSYSFDQEFEENESPVRDELPKEQGSPSPTADHGDEQPPTELV